MPANVKMTKQLKNKSESTTERITQEGNFIAMDKIKVYFCLK